MMKVKQVSTTACQTIYEVDGIRVRFFIITGGTPCIEFEDYSYSQRFENYAVCKWSNRHWIKELGCYLHQDPKHIQGPTFDVLPEGYKTVADWLAVCLPKKQLAEARFNGLPRRDTISKRIRDREYRTMVSAKLRIEKQHVGNITLISNRYAGRVTEKIPLFGTWWIEADKLFTAIHERLRNEFATWDRLTEDEYKAVVKILSEKACPAAA